MRRTPITTTITPESKKLAVLSNITYREALELGIKILTKIPQKTEEIKVKIGQNREKIDLLREEIKVLEQKLEDLEKKEKEKEEEEEEKVIMRF